MNTTEVEFETCIQACHECIVACELCISHMMGKESTNDCPNACRQCVALCNLSIQALAGDWLHAEGVCKLTSKVCTWCACNCREHDNVFCKSCADACEACAAACREVLR